MINLVSRMYDAIAKPTVHNVRGHNSLHPSAASVVLDGEVHGACLRQEYYKWFNAERSGEIDPELSMTAITGEALHEMINQLLRQRHEDLQIKVLSDEQSFYDPEFILSGRIDLFLQDIVSGSLFGCDIKTISEYQAGITIEEPRLKDVVQCAVYLDQFSKPEQYGYKSVDEWLILYIARSEHWKLKKYPHGSPFKLMWQFSVKIEDDGHISITDQKGNTRHMVDLTIGSIYNRYDQLLEYIRNRELPPRDYEAQYTEDKIVGLHKAGALFKNQSTDVQAWLDKGAPEGGLGLEIGDYLCKFCDFRSTCYSLTPEEFETRRSLVHTIEADESIDEKPAPAPQKRDFEVF